MSQPLQRRKSRQQGHSEVPTQASDPRMHNDDDGQVVQQPTTVRVSAANLPDLRQYQRQGSNTPQAAFPTVEYHPEDDVDGESPVKENPFGRTYYGEEPQDDLETGNRITIRDKSDTNEEYDQAADFPAPEKVQESKAVRPDPTIARNHVLQELQKRGHHINPGAVSRKFFRPGRDKEEPKTHEDRLISDYLRGNLGTPAEPTRQGGPTGGTYATETTIETKPSNPELDKLMQLQGEDFMRGLKGYHRQSQVTQDVHEGLWRGRWNDMPNVDPREYKEIRYTPVASEDPRDFGTDGYTLRIKQFKRQIRLLVCVTLYNEDCDELNETLTGIYDNIKYMAGDRGLKRYRKTLDWREIAVVIVQDGFKKCNESVLELGETCGFYSAAAVKHENVLGETTTAHMFEYTMRPVKDDGFCHMPCQTIFLTKVKNAGKLSSHAWFFNAICEVLDPAYTILFDAGTRGYPDAMFYMYKYFERHRHIGACGGELMVGKAGCNFLGNVQLLEWKFAYIFDVPLQSVCGYIQVLPGAFSAYRWDALKGDPLREYFRGYYEEDSLGVYKKNVYLAEDRILCIEIVAKKDSAYRLGYVKEAKAKADYCKDLPGLLKQRRRWLNGSFFAAIYSFTRFPSIWVHSNHSFGRKLVLSIEFIALALILLVGNMLGVALLFTFIKELLDSVLTPIEDDTNFATDTWKKALNSVLIAFYSFLLMVQLIVNINNAPNRMRWVHWFCTVCFGMFQYVFLGLVGWFFYKDWEDKDAEGDVLFANRISVASGAVAGMLLFSVFVIVLHGQLLPMLRTGLPYWFMTGAYINILQVYAFTNAHDVSWGTKGLGETKKEHLDTTAEDILKNRINEIKSYFQARITKRKEHKSNSQAIKDHNDAKEDAKVFGSYLILIWLSLNLSFLYTISELGNEEYCTLNSAEKRVCNRLGDYYLNALFIGLSVFRLAQLSVSFVFIIVHYLFIFQRWFGRCGKAEATPPQSRYADEKLGRAGKRFTPARAEGPGRPTY